MATNTSPAFLSNAIAADPTLPQLTYTSAYRPYEFEKGVTAHWLFDKSDSTCLVDGTNNTVLSLAGSAPTYEGSDILIADGINGLISTVPDFAVGTEWAVYKKVALGAGKTASPIFGTYTTTTADGGHITSRQSVIRDDARVSVGTSSLSASGSSAIADNTWVFVGLSQGSTTRIIYVGGFGNFSNTATKVASAVGRKASLGNAGYTQANWDQGGQFAEYGIVTGTALAVTDFDLIYARAKIRMARRGITLL